MTNQETAQISKYQKEYDQKFEEIKSITSKTKQAYVPILCGIIKKGWPHYTNQEIQDKVIRDCDQKLGWNRDTVNNYIPSEFRPDSPQLRGAKTKADKKILSLERENAPKIEQALRYFDKITEIPIKELPAEKPEPEEFEISEEMDAKLADMGMGRFGSQGKTLHGVLGDINLGLARAFKALTESKYMPTEDSDLIVDYIKPSREFRKSLAIELDDRRRTTLHNWLHYVTVAAEDMIEQIKEAEASK